MRWPSRVISPLVISPFCTSRMPLIARRVVVLPAPLAPRRATMTPSGTWSEMPRSTRITSW